MQLKKGFMKFFYYEKNIRLLLHQQNVFFFKSLTIKKQATKHTKKNSSPDLML